MMLTCRSLRAPSVRESSSRTPGSVSQIFLQRVVEGFWRLLSGVGRLGCGWECARARVGRSGGSTGDLPGPAERQCAQLASFGNLRCSRKQFGGHRTGGPLGRYPGLDTCGAATCDSELLRACILHFPWLCHAFGAMLASRALIAAVVAAGRCPSPAERGA